MHTGHPSDHGVTPRGSFRDTNSMQGLSWASGPPEGKRVPSTALGDFLTRAEAEVLTPTLRASPRPVPLR